MNERQNCVVEHHQPHDVPLVFVLRDPGRLWLFELCNPHAWPGNHWGVPDEVCTIDEGAVVAQAMTGESRSVQATGRGLNELRAALAARLAFLARKNPHDQIQVLVRRPRYMEGGSIVESHDWTPSLPPHYHVDDLGNLARVTPVGVDDLERIITLLSDVDSFSVSIENAGAIEFAYESERFYILHDSPAMEHLVEVIAQELNVTVVTNDEPLSEHAPQIPW